MHGPIVLVAAQKRDGPRARTVAELEEFLKRREATGWRGT
jgi:hypothetical protein